MNNVTGRQISAARALTGMSQSTLSAAAQISVPTLKRMEGSDGQAVGLRNNVAAVKAALETAGIIFVEENGEGPGVRLRKAKRADDHPKPKGPATDAIVNMESHIAKDRARRKR